MVVFIIRPIGEFNMCDLFSLKIASHTRCKLLKAGYETAEDLSGHTANQIASYAAISVDEANSLLQMISNPRPSMPGTVTALELLRAEQSGNDKGITTLSSSLDKVLSGGGIPVSRITEVCGVPGVGKTQLCLQLAVNVQFPRSLFGGLEGEAVYIDTEGSFFIDRLTDIAEAAIEHFQQVTSFSRIPATLADITSFSVSSIQRGIRYIQCDSRQHLESVVNLLEDFVVHHPKVKLVIVDSIAFHLRETDTEQINYADRTAFLFRLSQKLFKLAVSNSLAVVLTNQMTTRLEANGDGYLVPALGDSWNHACSNRLLLSDEIDFRTVRVLKSSYLPDATARFYISLSGIRDIPQDAETPTRMKEPLIECEPAVETVCKKETNPVVISINKRVQIKEAETTVPSKRLRQ